MIDKAKKEEIQAVCEKIGRICGFAEEEIQEIAQKLYSSDHPDILRQLYALSLCADDYKKLEEFRG